MGNTHVTPISCGDFILKDKSSLELSQSQNVATLCKFGLATILDKPPYGTPTPSSSLQCCLQDYCLHSAFTPLPQH